MVSPAKRTRLSNMASITGIASTSVAGPSNTEHPPPKNKPAGFSKYKDEDFTPVYNVMTFEPGRPIRVSAPTADLLTVFAGEFGRTGPETEHAMVKQGYKSDLVVLVHETAKTTVVNTTEWASDFSTKVWATLPFEIREQIIAEAAPELLPGEGPWITSFADLLDVMRTYALWYTLSSWPEHRLSTKAFHSRFHATLVQHCRFKTQRSHCNTDELVVDPTVRHPNVYVRNAINAINPRVDFPTAEPPYLRNPRLLRLQPGPGIGPSASAPRPRNMGVFTPRIAYNLTNLTVLIRPTKADVEAMRTLGNQDLPKLARLTMIFNLQLLLGGAYIPWGGIHDGLPRFAKDIKPYLTGLFSEGGDVSLNMNPRYAGHQVVGFGSVDEDFPRRYSGTIKWLHETMYNAFRFPTLADPRQDPGRNDFLPGTLDPAERDAEEDEYADDENQEWPCSWRTWRTM